MAFWKRKQQDLISLGLNRAATPEEERIAREQSENAEDQAGFYERFKKAVASTRGNLAEKIDSVIGGKRELDAEVLDHLEEVLIGADIGVQTSLEVIGMARQRIERKQLTDVDEL